MSGTSAGLLLSYDDADVLMFAESFGPLVAMRDVLLTVRLVAEVQRDLKPGTRWLRLITLG